MLSGFARVIKARQHIRLGWLTPLLGLLIMIDLVSFCANAWEMREVIPPDFGALIFAAAIAGVYYLAASLTFPEMPREWADLDDFFMAHRRQVVGGVLAANLLMNVAILLLIGNILTSLAALIVPIAFVSVAAGLMLFRDKRILVALMLLDISFYWLFRYA